MGLDDNDFRAGVCVCACVFLRLEIFNYLHNQYIINHKLKFVGKKLLYVENKS